MAKLTQQELELISAYIDDLSNGEINKPFTSKEGFCLSAKKIIDELDNLRKEMILSRSHSIEGYSRVQQEIANVTHDLKTPLAVITGAVECLEDGIDDKNYVEVIKNKTAEMNDIVLRIISSSRSFIEKSKNEKKVIDCRDLFPAVLEKYRYLIEGKKIKYIVKKAPKVLVSVAENEIISVIDNLLTNATKYTQSGKIKVGFIKSRKWLTLFVKDTGKGISKEDIPHVFDRFYSGDKARKEGGTGIGLNYVKCVIEEHGGFVQVNSKEGNGSTFSIMLPRAETKNHRVFNEDKRKCLEASLRLFLFPFFLPYDLGRAIYYGVRDAKNKINYFIDGKE